MEQTITAKIKIDVREEQKEILLQTMRAYQSACNLVSSYVYKSHDLRKYSVQKNTYDKVRAVCGLKSQMACSVAWNVVARYKTILENEGKWIRPDFRKPQLDLVWNRDYSLNGERFSVNTLTGRLKLTFHREGMEKYFDSAVYRFGTAKLVYRHGKFYLHIPVSYEIPETDLSEVSNVVGIDRGINFVAATYDSRHKSGFVSGKAIKQKRSHYKKLRQELQMKHTPSSRRRIRAMGNRENRWMQDVNHCVSKALVKENPPKTLFVLEDLTNVRTATERIKTKDRYVSVSWSFYDLEQKLRYKAAGKGQKVISVDPRYTSQTCPMCGHTEPSNRNKKIHLFSCRNCGYRSNDDRIGAMNLHRMGIEYLIKETHRVPDAEETCEKQSV